MLSLCRKLHNCLSNFHTLNFHFSNAPGDPNVQTCEVKEALFINSGVNPCELLSSVVQILSKHKGTFSHVDGKKVQIAAVAFNRLFEGEIVAVDWDIFQEFFTHCRRKKTSRYLLVS